MRVLLNPVGSHGDVHPFIGVGRALQSHGHEVIFITSAAFQDLVTRNGFQFLPLGTDQDYHDLTHDPDLWHPRRSLKVLFGGETFERMLRECYRHIEANYQRGDTVLLSGSLGLAGRLAHEHLGIPFATIHLQPMAILSIVEPPVFAPLRIRTWWPHWLRRSLFWFAERRILDPMLAPPINRLRAELGMSPIARIFGAWRQSPQSILALFPGWYGHPADWPAHLKHVGFVQYDQGESHELPAKLREFLDAGDPPIVVSFGSAMRMGRPFFEAAVEAFKLLNRRGLILAKQGDQIPANLPATVLQVDYAPFSLVLPACAAIIHHGGIGTSAQAMTAGIPQLVMPLAFDQPDNANRLEKLGVARWLKPDRFTGPNVAKMLQELTQSETVRTACQTVAKKMAAEPNPASAIIDAVEKLRGTDRK